MLILTEEEVIGKLEEFITPPKNEDISISFFDPKEVNFSSLAAVDSSAIVIRLRGGNRLAVVTAVAVKSDKEDEDEVVVKHLYLLGNEGELAFENVQWFRYKNAIALLMKYLEAKAISELEADYYLIDGSINQDYILIGMSDFNENNNFTSIAREYKKLLSKLFKKKLIYVVKTITPLFLSIVFPSELEKLAKEVGDKYRATQFILDILGEKYLYSPKPIARIRKNVIFPTHKLIEEKKIRFIQNIADLSTNGDAALVYFGTNPIGVITINNSIEEGLSIVYELRSDYGVPQLINIVDNLAKKEAKVRAAVLRGLINQLTLEREFTSIAQEEWNS